MLWHDEPFEETGPFLKTARRKPAAMAVRARDFHLAVVLADYHEALGTALLDGARRCLRFHGGDPTELEVRRVPGAFEIPQAVSRLLGRKRQALDAVVTLGVLIRGETIHFDVLARVVGRSLEEIAVKSGVPVAFGVLTVDHPRQARARSGPGRANKGWEAMEAALKMASLFRSLREPQSAAAPSSRRRERAK